jgi:hypothetical protein
MCFTRGRAGTDDSRSMGAILRRCAALLIDTSADAGLAQFPAVRARRSACMVLAALLACGDNRGMQELPTGTVTLLFSDIEGSTALLSRVGDQYAQALSAQRALLRAAFREYRGRELGTEGDSFSLCSSRPAKRPHCGTGRGGRSSRWPVRCCACLVRRDFAATAVRFAGSPDGQPRPPRPPDPPRRSGYVERGITLSDGEGQGERTLTGRYERMWASSGCARGRLGGCLSCLQKLAERMVSRSTFGRVPAWSRAPGVPSPGDAR